MKARKATKATARRTDRQKIAPSFLDVIHAAGAYAGAHAAAREIMREIDRSVDRVVRRALRSLALERRRRTERRIVDAVGLDIPCKPGDPVRATRAGVVIEVSPKPKGGAR
jgi:hypothetical protein